MQNTLQYAQQLDKQDPLASFREKFHIPKDKNGKELIYFCGNSLGCQPKSARKYIEQEMLDWENLAVEGHFEAKNPWYYYHHFLEKQTAKLVGAQVNEVVVMNSLTVNLNLLMMSFYRPTKERFKIIIEDQAFPSDRYAVENLLKINNITLADGLVELKPRAGEHTYSTEDVIELINQTGSELALIMLGGVNYYTGQFFELEKITKAAHAVGAYAGFDLAHAAGNVKLELHNWNVDFACWCSYKYLNSGPGGTSGVYIRDKYALDKKFPRLAGWWGNDEKTRFEMPKHFEAHEGAASWQMSNAQVLPMAVHWASLEIFEEAGMAALTAKSKKLTSYLEYLVNDINGEFEIITPTNNDERGCQLSILTGENGKKMHDALTAAGIISDWRKPNVIRIAPVPLYNTFEEVFQFAKILRDES